jgi:hypothetical protein
MAVDIFYLFIRRRLNMMKKAFLCGLTVAVAAVIALAGCGSGPQSGGEGASRVLNGARYALVVGNADYRRALASRVIR